MDVLFTIDWQAMFAPQQSVLEVVLRGSIMYLGMYALLRVFRRGAGGVGMADLLVIVVIADAAQNGMAGDSKSVTEAAILVLTLVLWDWTFNWLGFKSRFISRILEPEPALLIENGKILSKNLSKELLTEIELMSELRKHGTEDVSMVSKCYLESDGRISVLTSSARSDKQKDNETGVTAVNQ